MKSWLVRVSFIFLLSWQAGIAQTSPSVDPRLYEGPQAPNGPFLKKLFTNVLRDQKDIWTSPFHINSSSAKWWIFAGIGTAGLLAADHPTSQALPFSGTSVNFGTNASRAGQWYSVFPVAGAFYLGGWATHNEKLQDTGIESLQALIDSDIVVNVVKVVARRQRPGDGDHGGHFEKGGSSFFSGHAVQAWSIAAVVADEYGNHKWVPFVSYGYAALIDTSRILAQEHFTSDVFVGSVVGFFIGRYVVRTQQIRRHEANSTRSKLFTPAITPEFTSTEKTIRLAWAL